MSKTTTGILFAAIGLVITATYLDLPYFGGGAGVLLVAALSYAFVVAKRELALVTYVLKEEQIVEETQRSERAPARVPQGMA